MDQYDQEDLEYLIWAVLSGSEDEVAEWWDEQDYDRGIWLLGLATEIVELSGIDKRVKRMDAFPEVLGICDYIKSLG